MQARGLDVKVLDKNKEEIDLKQTFDEAIVILHNGEMIEGKVDSWRDFDESDVVQVTIEGVTYLTHYSNVILIRYDNRH